MKLILIAMVILLITGCFGPFDDTRMNRGSIYTVERIQRHGNKDTCRLMLKNRTVAMAREILFYDKCGEFEVGDTLWFTKQ